MKQTAVEWLVSELNQKIDFIPIDKWDMIRDIVQQAKEIEKEQSERRYSEEDMKQAYLDGCKIKLTNIYHLEKWFEQFKKK